MAGQHATPESLTRGTSAQDVEWFRRGLESGDPARYNILAGID